MKKVVDGLLALENDIDGDWEEIHKKFEAKRVEERRKEIERKRIEEESIFNVPYKDFVRALTDLLYSDYSEISFYYVKSVINRIFSRNGEGRKLPKSFHSIWSYFCNPNSYKHIVVICDHCRSEYDVHFKLDKYHCWIDPQNLDDFYHEVGLRQVNKTLYCPTCGYMMARIAGTSEIVSVNKVVNTEEERNDF